MLRNKLHAPVPLLATTGAPNGGVKCYAPMIQIRVQNGIIAREQKE